MDLEEYRLSPLTKDLYINYFNGEVVKNIIIVGPNDEIKIPVEIFFNKLKKFLCD